MANLRKRGNSYYAYWREGGKVREKTLGTDVRSARIQLAEIEKKVIAKKNGSLQDVLWSDFKKEFFRLYSNDHEPATILRVKSAFNRFDEAMTIHRISEITPQKLEEFKLIRKELNRSPNTINREVKCIKYALKQASEWGYACRNVWGVRNMPTVKKPPFYFTHDDLKSMLAISDPFWKIIISIGFYTGLRRGEILNLAWPQINFERNELIVLPSDTWKPKDKEYRIVPLHPDLRSQLILWKKMTKGDERLIRWNKKQNILSQEFSRIRKKAGIKQGSLHTLRHSFASHLSIHGVDINKIKELLGHESIRTTQIYAHLNPQSLHEAVNVLSLLGKPPSSGESTRTSVPTPKIAPINSKNGSNTVPPKHKLHLPSFGIN